MALDPGDPWNWSVEQLISTLCSPNGPVSGSVAQLTLDFKSLESSLRQNEVDGRVFLEGVDNKILKNDLDVKKLAARHFIRRQQDMLRRQSTEYQRINSDAVDFTQRFTLDNSYLRQVLPRMSGLELNSNQPVKPEYENPNIETPQPLGQSSTADVCMTPSKSTDIAIISPSPDVQPSRLAEVVDVGDNRVGNDQGTVPKPRKRVAPTSVVDNKSISQTTESASLYYGASGLKVDEMFYGKTGVGKVVDLGIKTQGFEGKVMDYEDGPVRQEETTLMCFSKTPNENIGLSRTVNSRMKYFFTNFLEESIPLQSKGIESFGYAPYSERVALDTSPSITILSGQPWAPEAIRGIHPYAQLKRITTKVSSHGLDKEGLFEYLEQKYAVGSEESELPAYGDSDSESLDSNFINEIDQDEDEIDDQQSRQLSLSEKAEIIEDVKRELKINWRATKLPQLEARAFQLWKMSRNNGSTKSDVGQLTYGIKYLEHRLETIEGELKTNETLRGQEKGFRFLCKHLEMTVYDMCSNQWKLQNLSLTKPPLKVAKSTLKKTPKPPTEDVPSDEYDLGDITDDDSLSHFIMDDQDENDMRTANLQASIGPPMVKENAEKKHEEDASAGGEDQIEKSLNFGDNEIETEVEKDTSDGNVTLPGRADQENLEQVDPIEPSYKLIVDLTLSEDEIPDPQAFLREYKREVSLDDVGESLLDSPPKLEKPIWREPPLTPSLRSPEHPENIVDLEEDENSSDDKSLEDLGQEVISKIDERDIPMPDYLDTEALLKTSVHLVTEYGDRRLILAWMMARGPDKREQVEKFTEGSTSEEVQPDVWRGLESLKSFHTKVRGFSEDRSGAVLAMSGWYIGWTSCAVPDLEKGFKVIHLKAAIKDEAGFEEFYNCIQHLMLVQKEHALAKKKVNSKRQPWLPMKKRQLRDLSDDEDQDMVTSSQKKRKYKVNESLAAKNVRSSAADRARKRESRRRELIRTRFNGLESNNAVDAHPVINLSKNDDEDDVSLNRHIGQHVFGYQVRGIQFMWSEIVTASEMQGCLLAQPMGMGKTLQVIALLVTIAEASRSLKEGVLKQIPERFRSRHFLILCPPTLVSNWEDELLQWVPQPEENVGPIYTVESSMKKKEMVHEINELWAKTGGILLMAQTVFRKYVLEKEQANGEDEYVQLRENLLKTASIVVCDEAQVIRGTNSKMTAAMSQIETHSRVALTGSPLSNNLEEYYRILNWVAPNYLGDPVEFRSKFVEPIAQGLYKDATAHEKRKGLKMLSVLKKDIAPKVHRDELSALRDKLPGKTEFVIKVPLTKIQRQSYEQYVESILSENADTKSRAKIWAFTALLQLLCAHPFCFATKIQSTHKGSISSQAQVGDDAKVGIESVEQESQELADSPQQLLGDPIVAEQISLLRQMGPLIDVGLSNKMRLVCEIIRLAKRAGEKTLVFSHSIPTLDFIEGMMTKRVGDFGSYMRLDGATTIAKRQGMIKCFNNDKTSVFLISTRAGGTGLNFFGASRVVILDEWWNPAFEEQAIGRAYRLGQKKHVFVYRLKVGGTFEDAMENQAHLKRGMASRVVDQKDTIRSASKGLRDYIFKPNELDQEDIQLHIGRDPAILDLILQGQGNDPYIRQIVPAETFLEEERETFTEEDLREIAAEENLLRLRRTDPQAYELEKARYQAHAGIVPVRQPGFGVENIGSHPLQSLVNSTPTNVSRDRPHSSHIKDSEQPSGSPLRDVQNNNLDTSSKLSATLNLIEANDATNPASTSEAGSDHRIHPVLGSGVVLTPRDSGFRGTLSPGSKGRGTLFAYAPQRKRDDTKEFFIGYVGVRLRELKDRGLLEVSPDATFIDRIAAGLEQQIYARAKNETEYNDRKQKVKASIESDERMIKLVTNAKSDTESTVLGSNIDGTDESRRPFAVANVTGKQNGPQTTLTPARLEDRISDRSTEPALEVMQENEKINQASRSQDVRLSARPNLQYYASLQNLLFREANNTHSRPGFRK